MFSFYFYIHIYIYIFLFFVSFFRFSPDRRVENKIRKMGHTWGTKSEVRISGKRERTIDRRVESFWEKISWEASIFIFKRREPERLSMDTTILYNYDINIYMYIYICINKCINIYINIYINIHKLNCMICN